MSGISIKAVIIIVVIIVGCLFSSLAFVQCSEKRAQDKIQKATNEAEIAKSESSLLIEENARLRETLEKSNEAVSKAIDLIQKAQNEHESRMQTIENDQESSDWLSCDLPNVVRDTFKDYCSNSDSESSGQSN